jgi:hypothetical protein
MSTINIEFRNIIHKDLRFLNFFLIGIPFNILFHSYFFVDKLANGPIYIQLADEIKKKYNLDKDKVYLSDYFIINDYEEMYNIFDSYEYKYKLPIFKFRVYEKQNNKLKYLNKEIYVPVMKEEVTFTQYKIEN